MDLVILFLSIIAAITLVLFLPIKGARSFNYLPPEKRIHEADVVLSRRLLTPGSEKYEAYYKRYPQRKEPDDRSRQAPGLLSDQALYYHPGTFAAAKANFEIIESLIPAMYRESRCS